MRRARVRSLIVAGQKVRCRSGEGLDAGKPGDGTGDPGHVMGAPGAIIRLLSPQIF